VINEIKGLSWSIYAFLQKITVQIGAYHLFYHNTKYFG